MTAIKFENISKQYRLGLVSTRTLSHDLNRWWQINMRGKEDPYLQIGSVNDRATKADSEYVWALRDINFEVEQGDVVGIIGKNGAGKSTLLKILSKVTTPTTGIIKAKGRIASLLEVGTGFHPEMTGRENIYMNGAIMGMSKAEINRKFDEIVDFAGVERYIDTPVKRYSSGMTVRLGFAVAAFLEPEILVVDEVLAVGDAEFQRKAIGKMQNISQGEGRTVLFVSHNMGSIQKLCTKGLLLKNGMIEHSGEVEDVVLLYQNLFFPLQQKCWISNASPLHMNEKFSITKFYLQKEGEILASDIKDGEKISVVIEYVAKEVISGLTIGISLFDNKNHYIYRSLQSDLTKNSTEIIPSGNHSLVAQLNTDILKSGIYRLALDASIHNVSWIVNPFEDHEQMLTFVKDQNTNFTPTQASNAVVNPLINWSII